MLNSRLAAPHRLTGKELRLSRIFSAVTGRALVVPIDHSVTVGPLGDSAHADRIASALADAGADALIVHKGRARRIDPRRFIGLGLIIHLSAGTSLAPDTTRKVVVGSVEECLALGADAVSVHVNVGAPSETDQLRALGSVATECERLGVPLLAMMYNRGLGELPESTSVTTLSHLAAIATDLGADVVKLDYAGSPEAMNSVVESCPLPIVVAGGSEAPTDDIAIARGLEIAGSHVAGLSFGRQIFNATNPGRVAAALAGYLHEVPVPARALELA